MWCGLLDFNIAHRAMMDEFASVLGRRLDYLRGDLEFPGRNQRVCCIAADGPSTAMTILQRGFSC
jgi:hypothetical protein